MSDKPALTDKQLRAIDALLKEPTTRAAATAAGVNERTLFRWLSDATFAQAYRAARSRLLESTLTALQAASVEAVKILREVMANYEAQATARVSAARAVLDFALKGREQIELEERLRALESAVEPKPAAGVKR
ncbi:MAG: hypothetical protein KIT57_03650 [Blastocatellales bacterium]|nr:hypothetical protein [Blastocatellales bacterium]